MRPRRSQFARSGTFAATTKSVAVGPGCGDILAQGRGGRIADGVGLEGEPQTLFRRYEKRREVTVTNKSRARAPATTLRSSRGTGRVGVDTYLSRCRHGRASRVLRAGVLVCGRWVCVCVGRSAVGRDWGRLWACGVRHAARVRRATWSPSCLPRPSPSSSFLPSARRSLLEADN